MRRWSSRSRSRSRKRRMVRDVVGGGKGKIRIKRWRKG